MCNIKNKEKVKSSVVTACCIGIHCSYFGRRVTRAVLAGDFKMHFSDSFHFPNNYRDVGWIKYREKVLGALLEIFGATGFELNDELNGE